MTKPFFISLLAIVPLLAHANPFVKNETAYVFSLKQGKGVIRDADMTVPITIGSPIDDKNLVHTPDGILGVKLHDGSKLYGSGGIRFRTAFNPEDGRLATISLLNGTLAGEFGDKSPEIRTHLGTVTGNKSATIIYYEPGSLEVGEVLIVATKEGATFTTVTGETIKILSNEKLMIRPDRPPQRTFLTFDDLLDFQGIAGGYFAPTLSSGIIVPPASPVPVAKNMPDVSKLSPRENVSPNGEGQIN